MVRPTRQDPIAGDAAILSALAEILGENMETMTQVEADILATRAGAIGGAPMSLESIGAWLEHSGGYSISKQRVSFMLRRTLKRLPAPVSRRLVRAFPSVGGANIKQMSSKAKARRAVVSLRRGISKWEGRVQYAKVLAAYGVEIPENRRESAESMGEIESVVAIGEDFNLVRIGRYRICSRCRVPKPKEDMFKTKVGLPYARCRDCNRDITREFYHKKRQEAQCESSLASSS